MSISPANLFVEYFIEASIWDDDAILASPPVSASFRHELQSCLMLEDGEMSVSRLRACVKNLGDDISGKLAVMVAIDTFAQKVHPRAVKDFNAEEELPLRHWLLLLSAARSRTGSYIATDTHFLVTRGPILRTARTEFASSAFSLVDTFAFLSVVPRTLYRGIRPIAIKIRRVNLSLARGVGPSVTGEESVAFIPIAEAADSLVTVPRQQSGRHYVDFKLNEQADVPALLSNVLESIGFSDIVMAPELVVSEVDAKEISRRLAVGPGRMRVFLAGSGNTVEKSYEKPWNQATLMNGIGAPLIRQRKVWQAGLDKKRANKLGLECPEGGIVLEDNCAGNDINVLDVDGFGRCLILICQDFQAQPLTNDLIRLYQPDWVFVPILDTGVSAGRWVHQRAYELSASSPARYLVASSTALANKLGYKDFACGLALGPRDEIGPDAGRVCALAYPNGEPGFSKITWRSGWTKTDVSIFEDD